MFDILAYLVERFFDLGAYPDLESLPRQLAAAGFEPDDIEDALKWLADKPQHNNLRGELELVELNLPNLK